MVACQLYRSSPTGPAEHWAGGSRFRSSSSFFMRFRAILSFWEWRNLASRRDLHQVDGQQRGTQIRSANLRSAIKKGLERSQQSCLLLGSNQIKQQNSKFPKLQSSEITLVAGRAALLSKFEMDFSSKRVLERPTMKKKTLEWVRVSNLEKRNGNDETRSSVVFSFSAPKKT